MSDKKNGQSTSFFSEENWKVRWIVGWLVVMAICAGCAQAGFVGDALHADYYYPDLSTILVNLGDSTVGPGIEFSFAEVNLDVSDTNILISRPGVADFLAAAFHGFHFYDVFGTIASIQGVTVNGATMLSGFDASRISFDADYVFLNLQGLSTNELVVSVDVSFLPEPSGLVPATTGLLALSAWGRRRRASSANGRVLRIRRNARRVLGFA